MQRGDRLAAFGGTLARRLQHLPRGLAQWRICLKRSHFPAPAMSGMRVDSVNGRLDGARRDLLFHQARRAQEPE